jgi:3-oxoacyl-[acyl-carrier protein] reductase
MAYSNSIVNLSGKIAVVFGGNGVLGNSLIQKFFLHNIDRVHATFHKKLDKIIELKKTYGDRFSYSQLDVTDHEVVQKYIDSITDQIDIGVNCVGIVEDSSIPNLLIESWENIIKTNLTGTFNTSKALFKKMKNAKKGRIINISSIVVYNGAFGQANYSASKAGIIGLTKTMAIEGAKYNILINCVAPGYIDSEMTTKIPKNILDDIIRKIPLNRLGRPDDVTNLILFLSSEYSQYITGEIIYVDGGL